MNAIEISHLTKTYHQLQALDDLTLSVPAGSIFGLLGPNGAGKTTTIRILLGLARATSGTAHLLGTAVTDPRARTQVGHVPDVPGFYPWMSAREHLEFIASLCAVPDRLARQRVEPLLDLAGLAAASSRAIGGFSRGMKQRLAIAAALINAPRLLLVDEPTSALDPLGRRDVLDLIASLAGKTTVLFSTHILADVERVCDRAAIMTQGHVVATGTLAQLRAHHGAHQVAHLQVRGAPAALAALAQDLTAAAWCTRVTQTATNWSLVLADPDTARRAIPALVAAHDLALVRFTEVEASLEDTFVSLIEGPA